MANQYGINMGNILSTVENVKGARQNRLLARKQDKRIDEDRQSARNQNEQQQQRNALLARLRGQALQGDKQAEQQLVTMAPDEYSTFMDAYKKMDEKGREVTKANVDIMGRTAAYIRNAQNPQQAYEIAKQELPDELVGRMPDQYNPDWVEYTLARAQEMESLMENPEVVTVGDSDRVYRGGQEVERTTSNALLREQEKTQRDALKATQDAAPEVKAADINAIYRQSAELLGGIFDQQGNLQTLDPNARANVQAIATEAARLLQSGEAKNIAESVTLAARKKGVTINNLQGQGTANPEDLIDQYVN